MLLANNIRLFSAALVGLLAVAGLAWLSRFNAPPVIPYVALLSLGSAVGFALLWRAEKISIWLVLGIAALLHGVALTGDAAFEDDYFRFIWDGYRLLTAGTPYGTAPSEFFENGNLAPSIMQTLGNVNNPDVPTIYGPVLQWVFAFCYAIAGTDPLGLRLVFATINLILVAMLWKYAGPRGAAIYGWSPFPIAEIVMHVHPDAIMAALIAAGMLAARRHPIWAGIFFGMAGATKIVALAAWPLLARMGIRPAVTALLTLTALYLPFVVQGRGIGFESTQIFAEQWYFNPLGYAFFDAVLRPEVARLLAASVGISVIMLLHARTRSIGAAPLATIFAVVLLTAPAVNSWYVLWILPFAAATRSIWPFAAAVVLPLSYLTGLNLEDYAIDAYQVHPLAWAFEIFLLLAAGVYEIRLYRRQDNARLADLPNTPVSTPHIAIIIPALNEAASIGGVVAGVSALKWGTPPHIIVVDNGSNDGTASIAIAAGALVVREEQRGYGAACLAGITALPASANVIMFMDADGSDIPEEALALAAPIINGRADLVIGSRALGHVQRGAMTMPQRFGNWLSTRLVWIIWGARMTDLGPFRAIRRDALERLAMADRDFGWTIEMQVKAVQQNMRITEIPADYRKRIGVSKISGTIDGVIRAGTKILYVIGREAFCR